MNPRHRLPLLMTLFGVIGCVAGAPPPVEINPAQLDCEVQETLRLYPPETTYRILVVPELEDVEAEHIRIYGKGCNAPAFYSKRENLVVVPRECVIHIHRLLRHEIGHAVVEAYFKSPVPGWLHEELAQRAEGRGFAGE